jgi:hypothetical protein
MKDCSGALVIRAGPAALAHIRRHGLRRADIRAIAGAAGGPKWLVLAHLDRFLFGEWLGSQPVDLVGSSIGAWRFAAGCHPHDPAAAIAALEQAYLEQRYSERADRAEISTVIGGILDRFFDDAVAAGVVGHRSRRLTVVTARARGPAASERRNIQTAGSGLAALANAISRRALGGFFERVLFQHPEARALRLAAEGIRTRRVPLTADNARDAVYASGSIPLQMEGVRDPAAAPAGVYRDGGLVDYHIDQPLVDEGLVLMPHFVDAMIPGWFDKFLPWRQRPRHAENTLLIAPSREFLARLPQGCIPDRKDFVRYGGRDAERVRDWRACVAEGERLADAFRRLLDDSDPARHIQPLYVP